MRTYKTITRQRALLLCLVVASTTRLLSVQGASAMTHSARAQGKRQRAESAAAEQQKGQAR